MTQMFWLTDRIELKAIFVPSGDHASAPLPVSEPYSHDDSKQVTTKAPELKF